MICAMGPDEIQRWFDAYVSDFAALGRGDATDPTRLLAYYGVPLILSTDAGTAFLSDADQVVAAGMQQIEGMRAAGYDRSEVLASDTVVANRSCAIHRGSSLAFARTGVRSPALR
jgi:hypothetical protein